MSTTETEAFCDKNDIEPGFRFTDNDGEQVFSRISATGHMICHPVGEPSMQDSWAWTPEQFKKNVLEHEDQSD